ncbi:haloacid dehalogenase type II [Paraburkholderia nemoris]|uniref:Phosphoglycolate phosphatase n=1 Tax=Paraburkholderia nemoris TaxID=2793076 RepID=A0ABM8RDS3_9BURK|nr:MULTISPECIES: haloacid dehalogenase type II [Paraburkholderia]KPD18986.1 hydrolase [Burkholderia sp. ST111]MBK5148162.1 haloacid dehalogenase type II [Burkholderia sp. R-69608]MBK3742361.1 haloacid dehalogenase type II [Paraburkholderia aspalathi]MBK3811166.1 haloacid dehalogenase type II [Paraburkholderia aspalathi]CAE6747526.1 Phosphoglycolate phosphatase [Paraburkholderia nemoris]
MSLKGTRRPTWLTFDCYGTLIQWDEGLLAAVQEILSHRGATEVEASRFIEVYDRHEHALEQTPPHRSFREVSGQGLRLALEEFGLDGSEKDATVLTSRISAMPPFPEVVSTLAKLKTMGFSLCIVSNTDDDVIAGNVAQLGGHIDRVVTAQQAGAYKPAPRLFEYAHELLGVSKDDVVHICASPHLDHAAARDIGFRCVWIDRGTGRKLLPDYTPDATLKTLDEVPQLFATLGW